MTAITGQFVGTGGQGFDGTVTFHLRRYRAARNTVTNKAVAPGLTQVFSLTDGELSGPGDGPYEVEGLDDLAPIGLYYEIIGLDQTGQEVYNLETNGIIGDTVDVGTLSPFTPGGLMATLGGDVTGPAGNNTVEKLRNRAMASTAPATGAPLKYDGTNWEPSLAMKDIDTKVTIQPTADGSCFEVKTLAGVLVASINTTDKTITLGGSGDIVQLDATGGALMKAELADASARVSGSVVTASANLDVFHATSGLVQVHAETANAPYVSLSNAALQVRALLNLVAGAAGLTLYDAGGTPLVTLDGATGRATCLEDVSTWRAAGITEFGITSAQTSLAPQSENVVFVDDSLGGVWDLCGGPAPSNESGVSWIWRAYNKTGFAMTIKDSSGVVANPDQIHTPAGSDVVIANNGYALLVYDPDNIDGAGVGWRLLDWRT